MLHHLRDKRNALPLQHGFQRIEMPLIHAQRDEVRIARAVIALKAAQQLGDRFIRAAVIEHDHLGEVEH